MGDEEGAQVAKWLRVIGMAVAVRIIARAGSSGGGGGGKDRMEAAEAVSYQWRRGAEDGAGDALGSTLDATARCPPAS